MKGRTVWIVVAAVAAVAIIGGAIWLLAPRDTGAAAPRQGSERGADESMSDASVREHAETQFESHLETCTKAGTEAPASCGITIPWAADFSAVDGIRYRIEQAPALTLTPPTFRADDGILVATVTGTGLDGTAKTLTYRTENWMLRGTVSVEDDGVVLEVW